MSTRPPPSSSLPPNDRQSLARPSTRRSLVLMAFAVVLLCIAAFVWHGHGYRTRFVRWITGAKPPVPHKREIVLASVAQGAPDPTIRFEKVMLPFACGSGFTCVQVGPDHRLYASTDDGRLFRFEIKPDGTVGEPAVFTSLQRQEGGKRLISGFCFDPIAPAGAPVLWVSHGFYAFHGSPDFTGRISRVRGKDLEIVEDVIVNLPRSFKDHLTNQPSFGPDGALYIPQGSNSAYGAPDDEWGDRPERLLNASVLRLDVTKVTPGKPLDVKTADGGGSYDPFAPDAPLTIYAEGLRNPWDLVWASNGRLYVPVNGSSNGGNTPAGAGAPALNNVPISEDDWLFCVRPGKYYGHPNPQQHHFVLNAGNPGDRHDSSVIPIYPLGTKPDPDWEPPAFDFGPHVSADGIIEYRGRAFAGKLDRKLIVCRFNVGSDLIVLGLNSQGGINSVQTGIPGIDDLAGPLDLAEDTTNGNLYVCEYNAHRITLMRPLEGAAAQVVAGAGAPAQATLSQDAEAGRKRFAVSCVACHGPEGQGIPHTGADLTHSAFIAKHNDEALAAFIATGRMPGDPNSVLGLIMPPKGGDPSLDQTSIRQIVAYLRVLNSAGPSSAIANVSGASDRR